MRIFCGLRCIFPSPAGARKNRSNEQNVRSYYMLNHRIRGLLFHYKKKKKCYLATGLAIYSRVLYAKPLNERLIHDFTAKEKMLFWLLFSSKSIQNILILPAIVAPFASAGIRPVGNRLNQDTTVYYGLAFCLFF